VRHDGGTSRRASGPGEPHLPATAAEGAGRAAQDRRAHRRAAREAGGDRRGRSDELPLQAVRRAGHQPQGLRRRRGGRKAHPQGHRREAPGGAGQSGRQLAHHRHERPLEHLRHRRDQVPHRLQRGAGGGFRARHQGGHRALLRGEGPFLRGPHPGLRRLGGVRHRGARGRRGRRRPREERGRSPGGEAREPHPARRHQEGRLRHPRRALREGLPGPLPHRRRPLRGDEAAHEAAGRHHLAPQDHGRARHQRATAAPGRPHQAEARPGQGDGLPRLGVPHPLRREGGAATARQVEPAARHDQARLRGAAAQGFPGVDRPALRDGARHRPHRARPPPSTRPSPS